MDLPFNGDAFSVLVVLVQSELMLKLNEAKRLKTQFSFFKNTVFMDSDSIICFMSFRH